MTTESNATDLVTPIGTELVAVTKEHEYAQKWAGTRVHREATINDFSAFMLTYLGDACKVSASPEDQYAMLIKVGNLALTTAQRIRIGTLPARPTDAPEGNVHGLGRAFFDK